MNGQKNSDETVRRMRTHEEQERNDPRHQTATGEILLDKTGRQNGRGAYICDDKECLIKAKKNKGLERSFKQQIPEQVYDSLEKGFDGKG